MAVIGQQSSSAANLTELQVVNLEASHSSKSDWATLGRTWWGEGKTCVPSTPTWTSRCHRLRLPALCCIWPWIYGTPQAAQGSRQSLFLYGLHHLFIVAFYTFSSHTLHWHPHPQKAPTEVHRCILKVAARPAAGSWAWAVGGLCYTAFTVLFVCCFVFLLVPAKETFLSRVGEFALPCIKPSLCFHCQGGNFSLSLCLAASDT